MGVTLGKQRGMRLGKIIEDSKFFSSTREDICSKYVRIDIHYFWIMKVTVFEVLFVLCILP